MSGQGRPGVSPPPGGALRTGTSKMRRRHVSKSRDLVLLFVRSRTRSLVSDTVVQKAMN
jgi:hypothetical protein